MKCKYCGAEIANDSVYCEQCGKFTNPFNKKGVTCSMSLVKWLLFGTMVIYMVYSYLTSHYWSWIPLLISLVISLAIFVVSLVLSIKKKISWVFTVFTFLFFSASATEFGLLVNPDEYYLYFVTFIMFCIEAGILLLYIIYEIVAASIARKRIRQS